MALWDALIDAGRRSDEAAKREALAGVEFDELRVGTPQELETLILSGFGPPYASWDGYQKNRLLMNRSGRGFVEVGFAMGVADEFDSRSALSEDLDRDGRVDLIVVEDEGEDGQTLHIYRNTLETGNAWIGVELQERAGGLSPVGATVRVRTPGRVQVREVVTGETLMGQHSTHLHFGLGDAREVESIEVRWPGGQALTLEHPEPGRYHRVTAPDRPGLAGPRAR